MQRKIQPNGMLCENSGMSMECNNLFISGVVHKNDHGSWIFYDVNTKKMHEANSEERWKPTKFQLHNCCKKKTYQTPFAHSFRLCSGK